MMNNQPNIETVTIHKYQNTITGHIRLLEEDDLSSIINLQQIILNNLNDADIFQPDSAEFLCNCVRTYGRIIGIIVEERLIAYCVIYFPKHHDDNLGLALSLPKSVLNSVAHLESVVVHPDYRGNSLALKMNVQALKIMSALKYNHICITVSPKNVYNLEVVFQLGFVVKALKMKYGGKLRYIFYKNLAEELFVNPQECIAIAATNINAQQHALQQGLIGYQMNKTAERWSVVFGKPSTSKPDC